MGFFENTRKPQGFGGRIMVKMMNTGHSKLAKWGFTKIYTKLDSKVLDIGCGGGANIVNWIKKCSTGHVTGIDYSKVSVEESKKLMLSQSSKAGVILFMAMYRLCRLMMRLLIVFLRLRRYIFGKILKNALQRFTVL